MRIGRVTALAAIPLIVLGVIILRFRPELALVGVVLFVWGVTAVAFSLGMELWHRCD
jgi:hypothetical protein